MRISDWSSDVCSSDLTNVYLTWTRGYKSGGFNALPLNDKNLEFEPERATSVELGAKARLLQGSLRVSAALFDTRFDNLQVSTFATSNGGAAAPVFLRSEEHTSELQSLMRISYAVFCLK